MREALSNVYCPTTVSYSLTYGVAIEYVDSARACHTAREFTLPARIS